MGRKISFGWVIPIGYSAEERDIDETSLARDITLATLIAILASLRNKWKIRKGWIKVHIAVDVKTKKLLALEATDERVSDGKMLKPLIEQVKERGGRVSRVYRHGGYDSEEDFNYLAENSIKLVIKIRNNSYTKSRVHHPELKEVEMKFIFYNMLLNP